MELDLDQMIKVTELSHRYQSGTMEVNRFRFLIMSLVDWSDTDTLQAIFANNGIELDDPRIADREYLNL